MRANYINLVVALITLPLILVSCSSQSPREVSSVSVQHEGLIWKTYNNSVLGYEILYPADWQLNESMSMGYPYVSIVDPIAQNQQQMSPDLIQGAMITVSVEEFQTAVPLVEYVKNFARVARDEKGQWLEVESEVFSSTAWGVDGYHLVNRSGDIIQHNHSALITYPETSLLFQIQITIPEGDSEQTNDYLELFDYVVANINFSPSLSAPLPDIPE